MEKETDFLGILSFELELRRHFAREMSSSSCSSSRDSTRGGKLSHPTRSTSSSGNELKGMFMLGIRNIGVGRHLLLEEGDDEKDIDVEGDVCADEEDSWAE